jgi:peptidoglycan/LPS O-acetylase OafA/YrhL
MSLAFVAYGPYPILHPTWTLSLIVEFSLIVAIFQTVSVRNGIYWSAAFLVLLVALGRAARIDHPALVFYTNPILIDFALGVLAYRLVTGGLVLRLPRTAVVRAAAGVIAVTAALIVVRPYLWPDAPRLLALGLPVSLLVFSAIVLERLGHFLEFRLVNFLAKCSFCIYLIHWFVNVVSEKIVLEGDLSFGLAAIMLIVVPILVTYLAIAAYLYVEAPMTRFLTARFGAVRRQAG